MAIHYKFGHRPPDISGQTLSMGCVTGVKRIEFSAARASFWHRHKETTLMGCLKGEMTYEFHGINPITLSAGSFLVIPAQVEHRHLGEVDPVGQRVELLLDASLQHKGKYTLFPTDVARELHTALLKKALKPVKCTRDIRLAFAEIFALAKPHNPLSAMDKGYVRLLLTRILYGAAVPHEPPEEPSFTMMSTVLEWIETHLNEPIPTERIVAKIGFSRAHVFTLFKKHTGLTPADYLIRLRVKKACESLKNTSMNSKQIAEACGFSSPSRFNAAFKRQTGLTPSQWRVRASVAS